ncbi:type VI secretion system tube protein TssD [Tenacibaculum discolor]|uniref:type VI secretion system tube protein TssD n=1 Tax=Tenacibaculum discolor TaxID=361581 RepID=UPI003F78E41C
MNIKAKLFVCGEERELISTSLNYIRLTDWNGKPTSALMNGSFTVTYESQMYDDTYAEWIIADRTQNKKIEYPANLYQLRDGKVIFYEDDFDGVELFQYNFQDGALINYYEVFDNQKGMYVTLTISPAMQDYRFFNNSSDWRRKSRTRYIKPWQESFIPPIEKTTYKPKEDTTPRIIKVNWVNKSNEIVNSSHYEENLGLEIDLNNPNEGKVKISITKKDNTNFDNNTKEIVLEEHVTSNKVTITDFKVKKEWEDFKNVEVDELVATATYFSSTKESTQLKIEPKPKILVSFRPNDNWKGEFGFDWIRENDTSLFRDTKFEDIISKQYKDSAHTIIEKDVNQYKGHFKKDSSQYQKLKEKYYNGVKIPWKKVTDANGQQVEYTHYTEWMSLKKGKEAKVKIHIDVTDKGDYLLFEDNENFTISPKKIDIKNKGGKKKLSDIVTIKCDKEFTTSQEIIIKAYKENQQEGVVAGKINVWANDASKHKQKKVVFVQVNTDINGSGVPNIPDATKEKDRINKYLEQAYIQLHPDSVIVNLDLTTDADFSRFVKNNKIQKVSTPVAAIPATATTPSKPAIPRESIVRYLKKQLKNIDAKYDSPDFFKAFYFAEHGYHPNGNLSGFSAANADYVVVFKSANDQTAAHEFLHSLNLPHTFTNIEASANAEFTYQYSKTDNLLDYSHHNPRNNNNRCSLFHWQWIKANNSI